MCTVTSCFKLFPCRFPYIDSHGVDIKGFRTYCCSLLRSKKFNHSNLRWTQHGRYDAAPRLIHCIGSHSREHCTTPSRATPPGLINLTYIPPPDRARGETGLKQTLLTALTHTCTGVPVCVSGRADACAACAGAYRQLAGGRYA